MTNNRCWNVYLWDVNISVFYEYNIFDNEAFAQDIEKCTSDEEIRRTLFYYFGGKTEYEFLLKPLFDDEECDELKLDVYSQIMLNFDRFKEYLHYGK